MGPSSRGAEDDVLATGARIADASAGFGVSIAAQVDPPSVLPAAANRTVRTTDEEDAERAETFGRLAREHTTRAYRLAALILHDAGEAEDATQEAIVTAWRSWPTLRDRSAFEAWFQRILVNVCRDRLRRHRRIQFVELDETATESLRDELGAVIDRDALGRAFRELSPDQRAVVVLRYWENLSIEEVAERVAAPVGTVKSRLHYALAGLRSALDAGSREVRS